MITHRPLRHNQPGGDLYDAGSVQRGDEHFPPKCLDTSRPSPDGEYPVVAFWLISRTVSTDSYASFAEYLEQSLAADLEVIREEQE